MTFEFRKCGDTNGNIFEGLYEVQPKVFGDERGCFFESYSERDFFDAGLAARFVQDNQSSSAKGVLRGLHFQTRRPQAKLVRAVSGRVLDVAVDLRRGSRTFGKYFSVVLDSARQNQLYIPRGFAHGFFVLSEGAVFAYKCDDFYDPEGEGGLLWSDETLAIAWKSCADGIRPVLSDKDTRHPNFDGGADYFDMDGKWIGGQG